MFYGYLNLESTKTFEAFGHYQQLFYGYLNLESTKTLDEWGAVVKGFTVT